MTSLQDMNMQEALSHSTFGNPAAIPSPTQQAMLMMQKALSAGNNAFPGTIPPSSSYPPLPGKDMMAAAAAAASLGGSTQANLMTQYYQMYQKLWGAALANGQGTNSATGNNIPLPNALTGHGGPLPHVPLPPSLPSAMPTTSTPANLLISTSSLSSPSSSASCALTSQPSSQLESFHHNSISQGKSMFCK